MSTDRRTSNHGAFASQLERTESAVPVRAAIVNSDTPHIFTVVQKSTRGGGRRAQEGTVERRGWSKSSRGRQSTSGCCTTETSSHRAVRCGIDHMRKSLAESISLSIEDMALAPSRHRAAAPSRLASEHNVEHIFHRPVRHQQRQK